MEDILTMYNNEILIAASWAKTGKMKTAGVQVMSLRALEATGPLPLGHSIPHWIRSLNAYSYSTANIFFYYNWNNFLYLFWGCFFIINSFNGNISSSQTQTIQTNSVMPVICSEEDRKASEVGRLFA